MPFPFAEAARIATGYPALDAILDGGIPRGQVSELLGAPTSGMTTFLHKVISRSQAEGDNALYIDLDGTFDPDYAARCGIDLDKLVVARTETLDQALEIVRDLLVTCRIGPLAVDFTPDGRRTAPDRALLKRIHSPLSRSRCALVFLVAVAGPEQIRAISKDSRSVKEVDFWRSLSSSLKRNWRSAENREESGKFC